MIHTERVVALFSASKPPKPTHCFGDWKQILDICGSNTNKNGIWE